MVSFTLITIVLFSTVVLMELLFSLWSLCFLSFPQVIAIAMDMFTDVDIFADVLNAATRNVAVYILLDELNAHHFVSMVSNCRVNLQSIQVIEYSLQCILSSYMFNFHSHLYFMSGLLLHIQYARSVAQSSP